MNFFTFLFFLLSVSICGIAQTNVEFFGGINTNQYFDYKNNSKLHYYDSEFKSGNGFQFGFALNDFKYDSIPLRVSANIINYKGIVSTEDGYLTGGSNSTIDANKYIVSLGLFPVNFTLFNRFKLNIGCETSYLIVQEVRGNHLIYQDLQPDYDASITNGLIDVKRNVYFGISSRIAYQFEFGDEWILTPQYQIYVGLTDEFKNIEAKVSSFRNYFSIGFAHIL